MIVAAGLDCRAYRLDWQPGTTVFEIMPKVWLKHGCAASGALYPKLTAAVPADLRTDWPTPLTAAGVRSATTQRPVGRGLLPYLTGDAQYALFARIDELCAWQPSCLGRLRGPGYHEQLAALETAHPGVNMSGDEFPRSPTTTRPIPEWLVEHGWAVDPVRSTLDAGRLRTDTADVDVRRLVSCAPSTSRLSGRKQNLPERVFVAVIALGRFVQRQGGSEDIDIESARLGSNGIVPARFVVPVPWSFAA